MLWSDYINCFAVALELEDEENYKFWVLAGQDPKKYKWTMRRRPDNVGERLVDFASAISGKMFGGTQKRDVWDVAKNRDLDLVYKVDTDQGDVYLDRRGKKIGKPKGIFIPTKHKDAKQAKWGVRL